MQSSVQQDIFLLTVAAYCTGVAILVLNQALLRNGGDELRTAQCRESPQPPHAKQTEKLHVKDAKTSQPGSHKAFRKFRNHQQRSEKAGKVRDDTHLSSEGLKGKGEVLRWRGFDHGKRFSKYRPCNSIQDIGGLSSYPYGNKPEWPVSYNTRVGRPSRPTWKLVDSRITDMMLKNRFQCQ